MRVSLKISITVLVFSCVVMSIIVGSYIALKNNWGSVSVSESIGSYVYILDNEEATAILDQDGVSSDLTADDILSTQTLDDIYSKNLFKYMPLIALVVCLLMVILTTILWIILRRIYRKQMVAIIDNLSLVEKFTNVKIEDKAVGQSIENLKEKIDNNLEDYRRLSSYLTHEQKNAIAVLRTNLEIEKDDTGSILILDRLTDGIDDILTLSTTANDGMTEKVDVSLVCAEVCDTYRKSYPKIMFSFNEEQETQIIGKTRWIYRAVSNLVDNAIKYGNNLPVEVSVTNCKGSIIVKIRDYGKGINPNIHATIFEHSYRMNGLKQDGHGIGLSVVSHVCDLCQGYVYVESEKNTGSTFYLSFPEVCAS